MAVDYYGGGKKGDWGIIGVESLGAFLLFLGIIGSFSPKKWKKFFTEKDDELETKDDGSETEAPSWFSSDDQQLKEDTKGVLPNLRPAVIVILGIVLLWFLTIPTKQQETQSPTTTSTGESKIHRYLLENTTNIRSCGSFDCAVMGQYPAGTEFVFPSPLSDLPEWIWVSWIDYNGKTQDGYIHWSTFQLNAFEALKLKSRSE